MIIEIICVWYGLGWNAFLINKIVKEEKGEKVKKWWRDEEDGHLFDAERTQPKDSGDGATVLLWLAYSRWNLASKASDKVVNRIAITA